MLAEYDENGTLTTNYTRADELISQERSGAKSYYLYDGSDSVRMLANEEGEITDTYTFDAFGNLTASTGSTKNDFLYRGEQYDSFTGLYYLRARYMNPATGTFITMDEYAGSVFEPVSLHKYLYANANPVMYSDPSGFSASLNDQLTTVAIIGVLSTIVVATLQFSNIFPNCNDLGYSTVINGDDILGWNEGLGRGSSTPLTIGQNITISSIDDSTDKADEKDEPWKNDDEHGWIHYFELDAYGRATGAEGYITRDMLNTGTAADTELYDDYDRGHLIAKMLGGSGSDVRNIVPIYHKINNGSMKHVENVAKNHINLFGHVYMKVIPHYYDEYEAPYIIEMILVGEGICARYLLPNAKY